MLFSEGGGGGGCAEIRSFVVTCVFVGYLFQQLGNSRIPFGRFGKRIIHK